MITEEVSFRHDQILICPKCGKRYPLTGIKLIYDNNTRLRVRASVSFEGYCEKCLAEEFYGHEQDCPKLISVDYRLVKLSEIIKDLGACKIDLVKSHFGKLDTIKYPKKPIPEDATNPADASERDKRAGQFRVRHIPGQIWFVTQKYLRSLDPPYGWEWTGNTILTERCATDGYNVDMVNVKSLGKIDERVDAGASNIVTWCKNILIPSYDDLYYTQQALSSE